jgi:hypothetical protein
VPSVINARVPLRSDITSPQPNNLRAPPVRSPPSRRLLRFACEDRRPGLNPVTRSVRSSPTRPVHPARRTLSGSDPD